MTVSTQRYLEKCMRLSAAGFKLELEQGKIIARGFADLGYEEFSLLSQKRMVSIYTGQTSELQEQHLHHFFVVATCDELLGEIIGLNFDIISLVFREQRHWELSVREVSSAVQQDFSALSLQDVLIDCLIYIVEEKKNSK